MCTSLTCSIFIFLGLHIVDKQECHSRNMDIALSYYRLYTSVLEYPAYLLSKLL